MPITTTGKKVLTNMVAQYGAKKGKQVYFASIVKGKAGASKWEGKGETGKLAKAKRTFAEEHPKEVVSALKNRLKKKGR